jgi:hypothetical protein
LVAGDLRRGSLSFQRLGLSSRREPTSRVAPSRSQHHAAARDVERDAGDPELGDICEQDTAHVYKAKKRTSLWALRRGKAGSGNDACTEGVELFPRTWTPIFFYVILSMGLAIMALAVLLLFVPGNLRTSDATARAAASPATEVVT